MLSAKEIPAGKRGQIDVEIKTANLFGSLEKTIHVATNDPRNPEVVLTVKATVEPEITVSEYGIFFGSAPRGREVRKEVILTLRAGRRIKVLGAETNDPSVSVAIEPVAGSNPAKWKLIAIQKANAKPGDHSGEILVKTSGTLNPGVIIYERGTVTASVK